ncbi:hypothetical protein CIG75_16530 [Tumebacillus algifaecis]|uniref:Uncharacterized protein n=1 Tax=Tumebacillus algifaecis TaxID=1214604 RepID=A0A223D486_9BACL|nr:hypothetical protein [Tumebacillus algifaecis]ASS76401.1 hypothetical protein CIG75_16530 [Tumebacillus algifaecis]
MIYPEYLSAIQSILIEYMPNETVLTKENADEMGARLLASDIINPNLSKKGYHQTVAVFKDRGVWTPVTLHWQTEEEGRILYVRVHTPSFIKEYGKERF